MTFFSAILSKFLDQYINKVGGKQIKVSLIEGHAELHNVSLTQNMLISFGIPLIIKDSKVEQVVVDFPIMKNTNKAAYLKIINVDIFATPEWDAINKIPVKSVVEFIQSMEDEKKATKLERRKVWNSWFEKVIDNATIEIRNIRLHIQFNTFNDKISALTLFLDSLLMNTIDSKGNVIILDKKPEILTKRIKMSSFAIGLHTNVELFQSFEKLNEIQFNLLQDSSFNLIMVHDRRKNSSFLNSFNLTVEPIFFNFNQDQFFSLQYLFNDFSKSRKRQKFLSCIKPLNTNINKVYFIQMWSYLNRCAIKIRRAHEFKPTIAFQFLKKRNEFAMSFEKAISKKRFIQKTVEKLGEDLTFLLVQYSSIISHRKERMIKLDKNEIDAINSENLTFFSKDSLHCQVHIQGICFNLDSLLLLSINDINAVYEKKRNGIKINLEVKNWLIDDLNSNYKVIQTNENDNFVRFQILSRDNPAIFSISSFKVDVRSSFLNRFCNFFINTQNDQLKKVPTAKGSQKVKSSDLNQYLLTINPRTLMRFKVILSGFLASYSIENDDGTTQHSFCSEVKHIQLKNYSKSSTESKLIVKTKMTIGQIKMDDDIISKGFSLKSTTTGLIDEFYYISEITTNLDVLNAKIDMNSPIIEKAQNVLSSITGSTQNYSTKIYSSHKININCCDISIFVDTERNSFVLTISGIDVKPTLMFRNVSIIGKNGNNQMNLPSICFNEWPVVDINLININLNANEFYCLLDEINWISSQSTKLYSSAFPSNSSSNNKTEDNNSQFLILAQLVDYKMGDLNYSIKFNDVTFSIGKDYVFDIESFNILNSNGKEFLTCDNKIKYAMTSVGNNYITNLYISNLTIDFLYNELNSLIKYYSNLGPNYYENCDSEIFNGFQYFYGYEVGKMTVNIEDRLKIIIDNLMYDYKWGSKFWGIYLSKINFVDILEISKINYQSNDYFFDLSISSINAYISPDIILNLSKLSFIPKIIDSLSNSNSENSSDSKIDMNVIIENIVFTELLTKLTLSIPNTSFTTNSYYQVSALHIPTINFESLSLNLDVVLLYNSTKFEIEKINSILLMDRKKPIENNKLDLTDIIININTIDFEYTHYFVMRIYNAYKIHSNTNYNFNFKFNFNDKKKIENNNSNYKITANIHQIKIKEHNLPEPISLTELKLEQKNDLIELKCHSINFIELIQIKETDENNDFFIIKKDSNETSLKVNPIDIYLNVETIKKFTNIYESLSSLIKTNRDEKLSQKYIKKEIKKEIKNNQNKSDQNYSIELCGIHIHFPFEDDPFFKKHDLTFSFKLLIKNQQNLSKLLKINQINIFFANYKNQNEMESNKILNNASFRLQLCNNNNSETSENSESSENLRENHFSLLDIEIGNINIYLSVLDILELQLIIKRFHELIVTLLDQKSYSIQDDSQKLITFSIDKSQVNIRPISFSICEESRASLPIFTIYIEATSSTLNLRGENNEFAIVLNFSIMHNNFFYGKFETFMPPTEFLILYSNTDSNASYFALSVKNDIDFNLTPYSFRSLIKLIDKFQNRDKVLKLKDVTRLNYNPEYWIRNSLDDAIFIQYDEKGNDKKEQSILYISPSDRFPLCQLNQDMKMHFKYKNIQGSFVPRKLVFPTYFDTISVSIHHHDNYSQTIVFNSPLSIQNRLDSKITIYINSDRSNKNFQLYTSLMPSCVFPLPLEDRYYFILSDFQSEHSSKIQSKIDIIQFDQNHLPEIFCLSKSKSPPYIKIQNIENQNSISFILNVNNDPQTNSRIYEVIPSFFIRNNLPCQISSQFYFKENLKINNGFLTLQSQDERQINLFNHDTQTVLVSLSFKEDDSFEKPTQIRLDKFDGIFAGCDGAAIIVQKLLKTEQKEIIVFAPCAIFNKTQEIIYFSPSSRSSSTSSMNMLIHKVLPQEFTLYGLESYSENKKSMKIDISIENSETKLKAIDCMRLNSNCTTVNLPRKDNHDLFYPINCSITLGRFPMNVTHIITFTPYLYVINKLPFDFSLVPITSEKVNMNDSNIDNIEDLHQEIENDSQLLLNESFFIPHHDDNNCVLIKWIPKDAMFLFSVNEYHNNPVIQFSNITRKVFLVKNKKDQLYIEINIHENKSTLYATFQTPSFPVPLIINNSLNTPIIVYQNIKPFKNKLLIDANSSSLFAFDEPFINNKQIFIEVGEANKSFLYSIEGQLSPIISTEHNINIFTTMISKNNSKMIQVQYLNDNVGYHSTFRGFLSIHSLRVSLSNDEMNEIVLFSLNDIISETCQDNKNTFLTLFIKSIQIDDQNTATKIPVCLFGTGQELLNENNDNNNIKFFNLFSIFPRGVPLFSVINYMSINIQPIFIIAESNFVVNLLSFLMNNFKSIYKVKKNGFNLGEMILEPSFRSVNVSKILISYFEINPINLIINIPSEASNDRFYIATFKWLLKIISMNKITISIPKLFISDFNHNISYLMDLFRNFYGKELMKQISKNAVIQFFASFLIHFKKLHFVPLSSISNDDIDNVDDDLCDNRKLIFKYFNQVELNYINKQSNYYFNQSPDIIRQLIEKDLANLSNILIYHPSSYKTSQKSINKNDKRNIDRLILGIKSDSNLIAKESNIDLIQLFQSKGIKRVRIPYISPIYSSFDDPLDANARHDSNVEDILKLNNSSEIYNIYIKIQSEILKNKKLENQFIKFIIQDKSKELLYCITTEMILIFQMQHDSIKIFKEFDLIDFNQISASGYVVTLASDIERIGQIKIEFNRRTDARTLVSFITSQQTVIDIFGHVLSKI